MRFTIPKPNVAPKYFLRQAGYSEISNPHKNGEISYARGLHPGRFYPRFHIYLETGEKDIFLNLHLDMKKPSYEGTSAHGGEYNGPIIEQETKRIKTMADKALPATAGQSRLGFSENKPWWKKILGL